MGTFASQPGELKGLLDLAFAPDPAGSRGWDLVDTDDGGLLETTDSRTAVIFQMESEFNGWWADHTQGSRIREIIQGGTSEEPADTLQLVDETKRCLQPLIAEGLILDLAVSLDEDEAGRPVILIVYRDSSTGTPVDIAYVPFAP